MPFTGADDPKLPHDLYCMLHMSRLNPGILNFVDGAAITSPVVMRCVRLTDGCVVKAEHDPLSISLTCNEFEVPYVLKAKVLFFVSSFLCTFNRKKEEIGRTQWKDSDG